MKVPCAYASEKALADGVIRFPCVLALILEPRLDPVPGLFPVESERAQEVPRFHERALKHVIRVETFRFEDFSRSTLAATSTYTNFRATSAESMRQLIRLRPWLGNVIVPNENRY
jgi:hypothetical protein